MIYTGIGSRKTPAPVLAIIREVARDFAAGNWTLRTGGAKGADQAFESGHGQKNLELYLPWQGFEGRQGIALADLPTEIQVKAWQLVREFHPNPEAVTAAAKLLLSRNVLQVLGADLQTPTDLVVCGTPDGRCGVGNPRSVVNSPRDCRGEAMKIAKVGSYALFDYVIGSISARAVRFSNTLRLDVEEFQTSEICLSALCSEVNQSGGSNV